MKPKTPKLLITLDAFGTLFLPREPIAKQYGDVARRHGLKGASDKEVGISFQRAFKHESVKHPNYGRLVGMSAPQWWSNVITSTFRHLAPASLLDGLVPDLLTRFTSSEGYILYPDVSPFFEAIRDCKRRLSSESGLLIGILTNSDDRVPSILESFGLQVSPQRYGTEARSLSAPSHVIYDIDLVALSYDVGFEKPHRRIFDATREMVRASGKGPLCIHVGDDLVKDYQGAKAAGWTALLLDRDEKHMLGNVKRIRSLSEVQNFLDNA